MPCYDSRNDPGYLADDNIRLRKRNDELARLLCHACKQLEHWGFSHYSVLDDKLISWWKQHVKEDLEREDRENERVRREGVRLQGRRVSKGRYHG